MKKILIPLATYKFSEKEPYMHAARETYMDKLLQFGKLPIFISCKQPIEYIKEMYDSCDSVLFMGGGDFSPKFYNEITSEKTKINNELEDFVELEILKWVMNDKKSFLGICRGCQALAIASGGKLHQHIVDEVPSENHGFSEGGITYAEVYSQEGHKVFLEEYSKIASLTGKKIVITNTAHHQAVKSVGESLIISGKSQAGVVEIIEAKANDHFCIGVQSHLENFRLPDLDCLFRDL